MSGGSYGYLYMDDDVCNYGTVRKLRSMAETLRRLKHEVAASMVEHHADVIEASLTVIDARHERLAEILKAVEWYEDCDWGKERVAEAARALVEGGRHKAVVAEDPETPPLRPETWAYQDHELELFVVPGRGEALVPAIGTGSFRAEPPRGVVVRWRGALYLVKNVETRPREGWAAWVVPYRSAKPVKEEESP